MDDVVIIGAGPVGLMLACELGLAGVRATVLEKRREPSDLPKANGLVGQIVEFMDYRGLLERLSEGSPFAGRPPGFPFGSVPLSFAELEDPPLRVVLIQQPRLERLLAERAVELGAEIRRGHELVALSQDEEGVTLDLPGERLRARFVVGCDGGGSLVREQAGIAFPGTTDEEVLRLGQFTTEDLNGPFEQYERLGLRQGWNRTPHGRLLVTSLQPGVHIVGVRERGQDPAGPVTLADFEAAVHRVLGVGLPLGEPVWLSSTVSQARLASRYREGRAFLAGDAAHLFPAGGSALNVGLSDAANLGWKLAAVLAGRMPYDKLDTYDAERRPVGAHTLAHTRAQAALEGLTGENGDALRELLTEVFAYEGPARHLAHLLQGSDIRYGAADHPLVGRFAPDLPLTTAAGPTRVAELMRGSRPVLLDLGGGALGGGDWGEVVRARTDDPPAQALLIRPDGYIAWAGAQNPPETWLADL